MTGYSRERFPHWAAQGSGCDTRGRRGDQPYAFDPEIYQRRNVVERAIARLRRYRAPASHHAKRAVVCRCQICWSPPWTGSHDAWGRLQPLPGTRAPEGRPAVTYSS
ncbi:hypothetical protein Ppa06_37510 [Planomonospora parontospora subsp. parontospora]|uniref:Transposase n=2 Tax=Planomonospora parontospora TaxID=58119 RepID=A0AA37BIY2_9ACTN|nr:hypothetical protein GCM10010126_41390 [Planomonospora parontospora]GII09953.1 hypothetical protein Ppa06_37510 [Planomonospora parontospora subsp. parontospora]